ncbi:MULTISPECIES: hypothetical protein [Pseudomonas]|uniref:Uncharacterized protein n=1 Tax=Pseudomonas syringae pv. papulans TaxID=83963 RepID=A0AA43DZ99_PSESX|nr:MULTISPECIES: hypothetical protein [Pseudomonas]MDH4603712.1 hypothetical protein [Pseudomonas syringae pv. papulans]MDH4625523.1 hypothetical protein [Pseudomonas syringae pv. papulans]
MYVLITPRRQMGVALPKDQLSKIPPFKGDVQIVECQCSALGRITREAFILNSVSHTQDALPRLRDANVTSMGTQGLIISGIEQVDEAFYFQSWWCRFE